MDSFDCPADRDVVDRDVLDRVDLDLVAVVVMLGAGLIPGWAGGRVGRGQF